MTECTSIKGEWSTPGHPRYCPDCKALMPTDNGPLRSDHAMKSIDLAHSVTALSTELAARPWSFQRQRKQLPARCLRPMRDGQDCGRLLGHTGVHTSFRAIEERQARQTERRHAA